MDTGVRAELVLGNCGPQTAGFYHLHRDLVDWVFIDNPVFHRPGAPATLRRPRKINNQTLNKCNCSYRVLLIPCRRLPER